MTLLEVVLQDLPLPRGGSVCHAGDPTWDARLGELVDPPHGRRYYDDRFGTSCGEWLAGQLGAAKAPAALVNRPFEEGGSGRVIGASIDRIRSGATVLGYLLPGTAELEPGDVYCLARANGGHVGVVVGVNEDGTVDTADAGQLFEGQQAALRQDRGYARTDAGATLTSAGTPVAIAWLVRLP